ncbi:tubulin--tyrosine ligase-like protein 12 isoform X1 [Macadamia integrifolia]|uniref:tubulin--tyrosine ligase-like protein 12 isoform X1 n=1 Tax=Macadamia integrifolia TaxID=60698 RepID=UPI001C4E8F09|nr:tubulin--tyrosine ligase-like protein 12 isoform X1 [Macadamia integrifolia]
MASERIKDFEDFVKVHGLLLAASGIPPSLHHQLFLKLSSETFDSGNFFQVEPCEDGRQRRLVLTSDFMEKESQLFLIDHAWTFRLSDARKQLQDIPGLAQRMASLMCVDIDLTSDTEDVDLESNGSVENSNKNVIEILEREIRQAQEKGDAVMWLELEELDIDDAMLLSLDLSVKFPNLLALSLCGNRLQDSSTVIQEVKKFKNLRALWLNDNPVLKNCSGQMEDAILQGVPSFEIYNSCFTSNFGEWALGFCGGLYGKEKPGCFHNSTNPLETVTSLDLSNRGIHNLFNKAFSATEMPTLSYLNLRGNPLEQNSAEDLLKLLKGFSCLQQLEVDIPGPLGGSALQILESLPNLSLLNDVEVLKILETGKHVIDSKLQPHLPEWKSDEPLADRVISAMWLFLMTYRLADEEKIDETSVWYVMDELGSALRHSDKPNFRVSPFLFMPEGKLASAVSFSILWPTQNIHKGDECARDFLFGIGEDKQRSARLTAWFHTPKNYFIKECEKYWEQLFPRTSASPCIESSKSRSLLRSDGHALRVYTDIPQVEELLTRPEFALTNDPKDADIIWTSTQMDDDVKKATGVTDDQYINQFPFEACLVMKHHLAETVQKAYGSPEWFQPTYNLETHLSALVGDYYVRKRDGLDNLWILKPWNMARTIDTTVTGDLSAIIRLMETGPKICQKYIERPALFRGKKFDLRYIVLVRSMNPLEIFLSDVFWARLANNAYSLDKRSFFEYETHFTVMNYIGKLNHMNTPDFVMEFEKEHQVRWIDIHHRVQTMIRTVFEAAAIVHPGMHGSTSRAIYGVDVMLDCSFQPKLLEVTYCPDCTRACKYDTKAVVGNGDIIKGQDFYNHVFGCLFLNETTHVTPL